MSDRPLDPAIALIEFDSIAAGIVAGDAMVKASPVGSIYAGTVHPGKYLVLVSGDTASVEEALDAGTASGGASVLATVFLPDVDPLVTRAVTGGAESEADTGDAMEIVETATVASVIDAADAGVKAARVDLFAVCLADGLGGKGYALFSGHLAEVEAAVEAAVERAAATGGLLAHRVIPQLHSEMAANLVSDLSFAGRVVLRGVNRGG